MAGYQDGKIYAIRSNLTEKVYIGSTIRTLRERFSGHKSASKKCSSKHIIQYPDAYIELIENYPCNSQTELELREGAITRSTANCVNQVVIGRTMKERDEHSKKMEELYRIRYVQKKKEKYEADKERLGKYYREHPELNPYYECIRRESEEILKILLTTNLIS
jgi:GIY-YIG catalytic domain